jgi:hypothetical protein
MSKAPDSEIPNPLVVRVFSEIPNPRSLRVRDLLFANIEEKADSSPRSKGERGEE